MEVHFSPEVQARLSRAAADHHSDVDEYVQQLVESSLDYDSWVWEQVKKGLDEIDKGKFLTHEEMGQHIEQMFRS